MHSEQEVHNDVMNGEELRQKPHVEVYPHASILVGESEHIKVIWYEGKQTRQAQARYEKIKKALHEGFLRNKVEDAKSPEIVSSFLASVSSSHKESLEKVVQSISAQEGRALVDIIVLQLTIKAICPEQDVRLHKGNKGSDENGKYHKRKSTEAPGRNRFSWTEGISMRNLDRVYIGPILREYDLLRMNPDGAFMTRSFSENYPYTQFYKAEIIGAKHHWLKVIDALEDGTLNPDAALLYVLDLLWKSSENFKLLVTETLKNSVSGFLTIKVSC